MSTYHILLVEDEPALRETLTDRFENEGYNVSTAQDGNTAFEQALRHGFDLIVLDIMLPGKNGLDVCRDLRQAGLDTPVLMLTARTQIIDKVLGLKLGADDYLTKPFDMMELMARIEALLRRARIPVAPSTQTYAFGNIVVHVDKSEVRKNGALIPLSALDLNLLFYFIEHKGKILGRDQLLHDVWGYDTAIYTRTVDVRIAQLRQKIEDNPNHPKHILTIHGAGYKFIG